MIEQHWNVKDAAKRLGISTSTIRTYIAQHLIWPVIKNGPTGSGGKVVIPESSLERYLANHRTPVDEPAEL